MMNVPSDREMLDLCQRLIEAHASNDQALMQGCEMDLCAVLVVRQHERTNQAIEENRSHLK